MTELKNAIHGVYQEHMKCEDLDGFLHDLSILIIEGLEDGFSEDEMTSRFIDYKQELRDANEL